MVALLCIFFVHITGQAFVTKYGTIFVKGLGGIDPMEFGILERGLGIIGPLFLMFSVDRLGRRPIFLVAGFLYGACLFIIAGIGTLSVDSIKDAIVAFYVTAAIMHIVSFHGV